MNSRVYRAMFHNANIAGARSPASWLSEAVIEGIFSRLSNLQREVQLIREDVIQIHQLQYGLQHAVERVEEYLTVLSILQPAGSQGPSRRPMNVAGN